MPALTREQARLLSAILAGWTLKAHRDLEGRKIYRLHPLEGEPEVVPPALVQRLVARGLLDSNKKLANTN